MLGGIDPFMNTRRLVAVSVLLTILFIGCVSARADEKLNPDSTSLGGSTFGGYVDSSATYSPDAVPEPSVIALLAVGSIGAGFIARRYSKQT